MFSSSPLAMFLEFRTHYGAFSVYPDPESAQFFLVMSGEEEPKLIKSFDNPLDAIETVVTQQTGQSHWDTLPNNLLPTNIFDISAWILV